ncbi:hypothetical protein LZZ85_01295 [Terrimonas sp. NA20]|uniref:Uncharacterized protein n=1 Tax=Terrimonas ginsenosidimutans TaxID=2908004 RepID=A0ABS9KKN8_9BACT|nr:hypothetical protein [Terrimonas ginsenosidimutans]MCG2612886.1 hypothetical protein [Terrimonas ginsenosidimutans]
MLEVFVLAPSVLITMQVHTGSFFRPASVLLFTEQNRDLPVLLQFVHNKTEAGSGSVAKIRSITRKWLNGCINEAERVNLGKVIDH